MKRLVLILCAVIMMSVCFTGCGPVSSEQGKATGSQKEETQKTDDQKDSKAKEDQNDSGAKDDQENKDSDEDEATILESGGDVEIVVPEGQESAGE